MRLSCFRRTQFQLRCLVSWVWRTPANSVSCVLAPRSDRGNPFGGFRITVFTIARLPDLVAPAVTHHRTPASWNRCLALGVIGALWPDQRCLGCAEFETSSATTSVRAACTLFHRMPLSVLGIATSWLSGQLPRGVFRRRAQLPTADAVRKMLHCRSRFS